MSLFGGVEPFDLRNGNFAEYLERLEQYFIVNDVDNNERKTAIFITMIGKEAYNLLRSLVSPDKLPNKTYTQLTDILANHLTPKTIVIAEQYKFYERKQEPNENIGEFIAGIRKLAVTCEFGDYLENALRDKFVCGMLDVKTRKRLLVEKELTLPKAIAIATAIEGVECESRIMDSSTPGRVKIEEIDVLALRVNVLCYRCNGDTHLANKCQFKGYKCNKCGLLGHIARACRSKNKFRKQLPSEGDKCHSCMSSNVEDVPSETVDTSRPEDDDDIFVIHSLNSSNRPSTVTLGIAGTDTNFEIDTGSGVSVISEAMYKRYLRHLPLLKANATVRTYTNELITIIGKISLEVTYLISTYRKVAFMVLKGAGVNLLGRDLLMCIKIDWSKYHVNKIDGDSVTQIFDKICPKDVHPSVTQKLNSILSKYHALFEYRIGTINGFQANIHLKPDSTPEFMKSRSIPFALQEAVSQELDRLIENKILQPISYSDWASPIVIISKPDGGLRICGDFKATVNPNIESEVYPTPTNDEIFTKIQGGERFSEIDLRQAYLQLELADSAKKVMAVNTLKGLIQYLHMPYGIKPAGSIFQNVMDTLLGNIPMVGIYTDDILISGRTDAEHLQNREKVLCKLSDVGITIRKEKCKFFMSEVENLGHIIDKYGIRVNLSKTDASRNAREPNNVKELQSFIGGVNYYFKFIPNMAIITKPLYLLLQKNMNWEWGDEQKHAFAILKTKLIHPPVLTIYDGKLELKLDCDASMYGLGVVLSHVYPDGNERPIAYASRSLLAGSRLVRWSLMLNSYDYEIELRNTTKHNNADMLSRIPSPETAAVSSTHDLYQIQINMLPVTADIIRSETSKDPSVIVCLKDDLRGDEPDRLPYFRKRNELSLEDGILMWGLRVVVPTNIRKLVLEELHKQHPGIVRMKSLARLHVWYPNIDKDVKSLVNASSSCKMVENQPPKSNAMDRVHMDFFGPFFNKTFLIMVDSYSKLIEVEVMCGVSTNNTINVCRKWFSRYGLPNQVVTDNGSQYINHIRTTPYHQSSNGQPERLVQTVKQGLKKNDIAEGDAQKKLDNYLFAYRSTPSTVTGKTPAELFIDINLKCKLDLLKPPLDRLAVQFTNAVSKFTVGERVFIRNYNSKGKWLSGVVHQKIGNVNYEVDVDGKLYKRHVDQLLRNRTSSFVSSEYGDYYGYDCDETVSRPVIASGNRFRKTYPKRVRNPVSR